MAIGHGKRNDRSRGSFVPEGRRTGESARPRAVRELTQVCGRADGSQCTATCDRLMSASSTSRAAGPAVPAFEFVASWAALLLVGLVGSVGGSCTASC
jgi:hypothetical protein